MYWIDTYSENKFHTIWHEKTVLPEYYCSVCKKKCETRLVLLEQLERTYSFCGLTCLNIYKTVGNID